MTLKDIATILNETVMTNALGVAVTVAEDLSNINDVGTALANATASQFKDFTNAFVAGILRTEFDTRAYKPTPLGIMRSTEEYKGLIQSIKAKYLRSAVTSPIGTLTDNQSYIDGKFHGTSIDNKIYDKWASFRIPFSIPNDEQVKQSFTSIEGVTGFVALIRANVENSRQAELHALEKRVINKLIAMSIEDGRAINLPELYNSLHPDETPLTTENCQEDATFLRWCALVIARIKSQVTEMNSKYNDGTVPTFCPESDIKVLLLNEFAKSVEYNMLADTYHNDMVGLGNYQTVPYWQNQGANLLDSLGVTAEIVETNGLSGASEVITTYSNVVGIIYDNMSAGATSTPLPLATEVVGAGRFVNYYHDEENKYMIDTRNSAIVFTLEDGIVESEEDDDN